MTMFAGLDFGFKRMTIRVMRSGAISVGGIRDTHPEGVVGCFVALRHAHQSRVMALSSSAAASDRQIFKDAAVLQLLVCGGRVGWV
jgi:hypothetical protein